MIVNIESVIPAGSTGRRRLLHFREVMSQIILEKPYEVPSSRIFGWYNDTE